jgi:predicted ATPase
MDGNLPARLTSFIGRAEELRRLAVLVGASRLVTLTGPGGSGKTSLAVESAREQRQAYPDGTWFVPLDGVDDPGLVAPSIATNLGLLDVSGVSAVERLVEFMRERSLLLILDNFEHVLEAASVVAQLLAAGSRVRVLVTSRTPLHVAAEQEFPVVPLGLPDGTDEQRDPLRSDAVRLFVERARLTRPSFQLTPTNTSTVVDICRRLDGLPLGIELAASRVRYFSPDVIAQRLAGQLDVPGPGVRDLPERQQTLERVVAWSYGLLEPPKQQLLSRLSVFAGGCALAEAEAVCCTDSDSDVLDGLATLIDQNLVLSVDDRSGSRFRLLETIRAFALRRLAESDELAEARRRHALAFLELAEAVAPQLPSRHQLRWLDRLSADHDNLRAAVRWAIDERETETALRFAAALWRFWQIRGHVAEGRRAVDEILALPDADRPSATRIWALSAAGGLAWWAADIKTAEGYYVAQLDLARAFADKSAIADAMFNLAWPRFAMDAETGAEAAEELLDKASRLYTALEDERALARVDTVRGYLLLSRLRIDDAKELLLKTFARHEQLEDDFYADIAADSLSAALLASGETDAALRWQLRSLRSYLEMGNVTAVTAGLPGVFPVLAQAGLVAEAATVDSAYGALCERYGVRAPVRPDFYVMTETARERMRDALSHEVHSQARLRGSAMSLEDVVDFIFECVEGRRGAEAEVGPASEATDRTVRAADRFVREGDVWAISYEKRTWRMRDAKGLQYLAQLLAVPGRELTAMDLAGGKSASAGMDDARRAHEAGLSLETERGDALIDGAARTAYRERLKELQQDIDEAEQFGDWERTSRLREEFDFLTQELAAATGFGGRTRESTSAPERARIAVTKAIHNSIQRIERHDASLGVHLRRYVHTGRMCSYSPDPGLGINWIVES